MKNKMKKNKSEKEKKKKNLKRKSVDEEKQRIKKSVLSVKLMKRKGWREGDFYFILFSDD